MLILGVWITSLSAQITRGHADNIVREHLQNEFVQSTLYVHANLPNEEGISITTSNEEVFKAKYACWIYYLDENEPAKRRYLFVKEDNGNLLEVIASNDNGSADTNHWLLVTTSLADKKGNNLKPFYPNPTTGKLTIDNEQFTIDNVAVFDMMGKMLKVESNKHYGEIIIDISHLPSGVYLLKIRTKTGIIAQKIIKN